MSLRSLTLPTNLTLQDWSAAIVYDLLPYGTFYPFIGDDREWATWGAQFLNTPTMPDTPPNPYQFRDWREWADRFCQVLLCT